MAWIGKSLVVAIFLGSLAFLGFAISATIGGPNWTAEMRELEGTGESQGFLFNRSEGIPAKWTVKRIGNDQQISSSPIPAVVVIAAMESLTRDQSQKLQALRDATQALEEKKAAWDKAIPTDEASLERARVAFLSMFEATRKRGSELANQVSQKTEEAQKIEQRIAERRDDVIRLKTQLGELRADRFRLDELKTELNDQLQQLFSLLERAEERQEQLQASGVR